MPRNNEGINASGADLYRTLYEGRSRRQWQRPATEITVDEQLVRARLSILHDRILGIQGGVETLPRLSLTVKSEVLKHPDTIAFLSWCHLRLLRGGPIAYRAYTRTP